MLFCHDTVHIVGRRRWNRRGAMVTDRYQHLMHHESVEKLIAWAAEEGLTVVAIDNTPGCVPLETAELPERSLLLFGQEGPGVTQAAQDNAMHVFEIPRISPAPTAAEPLSSFDDLRQRAPLASATESASKGSMGNN